MREEERRSAHLLFASELYTGAVDPKDLDRNDVARAVRSRRVPPKPVRAFQRLAQKHGRLTYEDHCLEPLASARRAVLGERGTGAPRFLVRVDEFPHASSLDHPERYGPAAFERFHSIMSAAGVDYLIAVTPRLSGDYLNPHGTFGREMDETELDILRRLRADRVAFAQHGHDHRTRDPRARHRSELAGLSREEVSRLLDRARAPLAEIGIHPQVFVPPFNRFDARQYEVLAGRYEVVCGGCESVAQMGFHRTPLWRGDAVYLPAYSPLYERASGILAVIERVIERGAGTWVPLVLHWGWEADDGWSDLERLAERLAPYAYPWQDFLDAVQQTR